ncbi:pyruvate dehydrogenase (acetyl-transferring), homodimeric type [Motilibacter deserti]|uniref:Pyruvate dehydrogenase E1 component n=1 Tax=Motilibacter deserti TaxID=2714956 RepID=A0ABX0GQY1_9ACTN|nr:pyruvate dehydrogenase (acetyl-transferring), homodimeric type [Motilibacter deserti]
MGVPVPPVQTAPASYQDVDSAETQEWLESLDALVKNAGPRRARYIVQQLLQHAGETGVPVPGVVRTDYVNTIGPDREPDFPGDEALEERIANIDRWNAAVLVSRANRPGVGVGGHIASFASSATLYETGWNHFFQGPDAPGGGDQIFWQGHASPGMYARAFLEGRLSEDDLDSFRQELTGPGKGLPSYPHPRLMSDFWQFPTVSMGLGPIDSIYQARFNRYLHNRGIKDTSNQRVWAFLGDGEMDEVESIGALGVAAREGLDNLTWVVNCNLQRLDGPVRGNGKIIQELEGYFRGAGWNVVKVVWGREWDELFARDTDGVLAEAMADVADGQWQTYSVESGAYFREHFFGRSPQLAKLVEDLTDEQLKALRRGGHDPRKVFAAYKAATEHKGAPSVVIVQTVKGWGLRSFEARNATHQMKKLSKVDVKEFRDRLGLPIPDEALADLPPYYHPGEDSPEVRYLRERRAALGGSVPQRRDPGKALDLPEDKVYAELKAGSGKQPVATTMATVRLIKDMVKIKGFGERIVPIIPDEARTFGLDALFPTAKIYSPHGQRYEAVDRALLLSYKESTQGQLLNEGITEAGSMGSMIAAGTSYSTHGEPMIPMYIFYSMFGFQRTGDQIWKFGDQLGRGFLLGATAGRTTLNGEGLQHEDGHSPLIASTNPACVYYDPAWAFEVGHIVKDGLRRMYGQDAENVFYYLTIYNEPYLQPAEPEGLDVDGLLKGLYRYASAPQLHDGAPGAQILASGVAMQWALDAQKMLAEDWGVAADVWSATSWNELRREALECDGANLLNPDGEQRVPYITRTLAGTPGPVIAVSDYMRTVQDQVRPWVQHDFVSLGTDGFGLSDTRGALRRHFKVDAASIVVATLMQLARQGGVKPEAPREAVEKYQLGDIRAAGAGNTLGES